MEKRYFKMLLAALICVLFGSTYAQAYAQEEPEVRSENIYASLYTTDGVTAWGQGNGLLGCTVKTALSAPKKVLEVPFKVEQEDLFVKAGCSAGTSYLALMGSRTGKATSLYSLNMATGQLVTLAENVDNASKISDMAYDEATGKLYGIESDDSGSSLYDIDYKNGTITSVATFEQGFYGLAAKNGLLYTLKPVINDTYTANTLSLFTIDPATNDTTKVAEDFGTMKRLGETFSLAFNADQLIFVTMRYVYTINFDDEGVPTLSFDINSLRFLRDLTGIAFEASTTDLPADVEEPEQPEAALAYVGLVSTGYVDWPDGNGEKGCIIAVDPADPSVVKEVPVKIEEEDLFQSAGTAAGTAYYAIMKDEDENAYLYTHNFSEGKYTKVASVSNGGSILDMTYDATSGKLYALENGYGETGYESYIYTVTPTTGKLTLTTTVAGHSFVAMDIDANGKINAVESSQATKEDGSTDWWHVNLNLYTIDLTSGEATAVFEKAGSISSLGYVNSMAFNEGKLYLQSSHKLYVIDPESKEVTLTATEFAKEVCGLTFTLSTTDAVEGGEVEPDPEEPEVNNYLEAVEERYGSAMGDADGVTQKTVFFYDKNYNLVRKATYGRNYASAQGGALTDDWQLSYYYTYDYNDKGQLALTFKRQWGLYDGADYGFSTANDSTSYEYNEDGTLAKETESAFVTTYTYDESGNLTSSEKRRIYKGTVSDKYLQKLTYSDFVAKNCPAHIKSESEQSGDATNLVYEADLTYNEKGKLLTQENYTMTESTDPETGAPVDVKKVVKKVINTYFDNGMLKSVVNYSNPYAEGGELIPTDSTVYTPLENDENRMREDVYIYDSWNEAWGANSYYLVHNYKTFDASTSTEIAVEEVADKINSNKVTVSFPNQELLLGSYTFDLYRDGVCIKRLNFSDETLEIDATNMTVAYTDADLKNAEHDYFVQSVSLDELGSDTDSLNVSNVAKITNNVNLPAPQNLRADHKYQDESGNNLVTMKWDAPDFTEHSAEELGFERYNVMIGTRARTADNSTTDGQATEWDVNFYTFYTTQVVSVQAVYKYGKATTEQLTVNLEEVSVGISQLNGSDLKASFNNGALSLSAPANIAVFNAAGQNVAKAAASTGISLSNLPKGVYVITIEQNGKVNAVKVTR